MRKGVLAADPLRGPVPDQAEEFEIRVPPAAAGTRLDAFLAEALPRFSRVSVRRAIAAGDIQVNNIQVKPAFHLKGNERISGRYPRSVPGSPQAEYLPLDILYEDEHLAVVNKAPGIVVHPAKGHWSGTLVAGLQYHFEQLSGVGGATRPGIVHRLDRDTSGVLVVAKTDIAHMDLNAQFTERSVEKEYRAIVMGRVDRDSDVIDLPIGVHPYQREKKAIRHGHATSRPAQTFYEVLERFAGFTYVTARPKTGRTHQIRLHLETLGCPVLCDRLYGGRARISRGELRREESNEEIVLDRQALHAYRLSFLHPVEKQIVSIEAPLPPDMQAVLAVLRGETEA